MKETREHRTNLQRSERRVRPTPHPSHPDQPQRPNPTPNPRSIPSSIPHYLQHPQKQPSSAAQPYSRSHPSSNLPQHRSPTCCCSSPTGPFFPSRAWEEEEELVSRGRTREAGWEQTKVGCPGKLFELEEVGEGSREGCGRRLDCERLRRTGRYWRGWSR